MGACASPAADVCAGAAREPGASADVLAARLADGAALMLDDPPAAVPPAAEPQPRPKLTDRETLAEIHARLRQETADRAVGKRRGRV